MYLLLIKLEPVYGFEGKILEEEVSGVVEVRSRYSNQNQQKKFSRFCDVGLT